MDDEITFEEALDIVKDVLNEIGITTKNEYDMLLVKQLPDADIILKNKQNSSGKTTHIALTGEKMDIFPFLEGYEYFYDEDYDTKSKLRFFLDVPINLWGSNLDYLDTENEFNSFGDRIIETSATIVRNRKNDTNWSLDKLKRSVEKLTDDDFEIRKKLLGYDVQAELSSDYSGETFKEFRELLYPNDFLIILKHKAEFKYDVFGISEEDGEELLPIDYELFTLNKKTVAPVSVSLWANEDKIDIIKEGAENVLLYGVPGSGKSWTIAEEYCGDESRMERVVFHPDYTYSDFIGQILPKVSENDVDYVFTPGPFTSILKEACSHKDKMYYLIIEEINRGNAPAIFGDIFQLLDRKTEATKDYPIGTSVYAITNADIAREVYNDSSRKIRIPSNLSIIATMNTADQNVFTLDTAFQRRWNMRLIPNKFKKDHEFRDGSILDTNVTWEQFVTNVNNLILKKNTLTTSSEDKRLGVYFVKEEDLQDANKFSEKVLKYLWDDAFKFSRDQIFDGNYKSLEDIIEKFTSSEKSFRFDIFKDSVKSDIFKGLTKENQDNTNDENEESEM